MATLHVAVWSVRNDGSEGFADVYAERVELHNGLLTKSQVESLRAQAVATLHDCRDVIVLSWSQLADE